MVLQQATHTLEEVAHHLLLKSCRGNSNDLQIEKKRTEQGGQAVAAAAVEEVEVEVVAVMVAVAVAVMVAVAVAVVVAVAAVVVEVVEAVEAMGARAGIVAVMTVPHWICSVFGHQLEQKSGQGYFQDSLEARQFSHHRLPVREPFWSPRRTTRSRPLSQRAARRPAGQVHLAGLEPQVPGKRSLLQTDLDISL